MKSHAAGDLTRDCLVFLKDRQVSSFGCFAFEFWVLRFRFLGASCFGLRFRVRRFRNYRLSLTRKYIVLGNSFSARRVTERKIVTFVMCTLPIHTGLFNVTDVCHVSGILVVSSDLVAQGFWCPSNNSVIVTKFF